MRYVPEFTRRLQTPGFLSATLLLILLVLFTAQNAFAVAAFTRQTGMSCNQCHLSHGAATPNFTFSGKKFKGLGYRIPNIMVPLQDKGEPEDQGEYLQLNPVNWSGRFQFQVINNVKPPAGPNEGDWGEEQTITTSRFAVFPFVGNIGEHFGIWTEIYIVNATSARGEWTLGNASWEEFDFRYTINPDSRENVYGIALSNQGPAEIFGFGPWPAVGLPSEVLRGGIGGNLHPNRSSLMAYGWMNDRWAWAIGPNTGDTNFGWDDANITGFLGYAIKNGFSEELWIDMFFRTGKDAIPLVTDTTVEVDRHDFYYEPSVGGITETRPAVCPSTSRFIASGCPYLAEDMDDHTTVDAEVRWSRMDFGNWSWEIVGRLGYNDEDYLDGASTERNTWGIATQFAWNHTWYIKPYMYDRIDYEFTDRFGTRYDIDTEPTYGIWLAYKPVENFLLSFEYHTLQSWSLTGNAQDDGARYSITADISF